MPVDLTSGQRTIVVGGGLFGSAAARHLAERGHNVTVLLSSEPSSGTSAASRPMASHYDQGRIVGQGGSDPFVAEAGRRSAERFPDLAERSGITFFTPRPLVILSPEPQRVLEISQSQGAEVTILEPDQVTRRYGIVAPAGFDGAAVVETATAAIVNPRLLVQAQLSLAAEAGAVLIDSPAESVTAESSGVSVATADGQTVDGRQLVLATGAYGAKLLGLDLPIQRRLRTIALITVEGPTDEMPTLSASGFVHPTGDPKLEETYWVPPLRYPDGGDYLKIGGNSLPMITASTNDDIGRWFGDGGSADEAAALFALAADMLPGRRLRLAGHKPCVVAYTPDEQPIVKRISDQVVVALAGNGSGAKMSDEIGRRAAELCH